MKDEGVTIKDVARIAKVSPSTVSLVLNNKPGVHQETRYRVHKIAEALNYRPNLVARSLVKGRSHAIALLITSTLNPIFPEMAAGMDEVLRKHGYSLSIISIHGDQGVEATEIQKIRARGIDGIITSDALIDSGTLKQLARSGYPVVSILRRVYDCAELDFVVVDCFRGAYLAVEHLIRLGHTRIGIIKGPLNTSTGIERAEGSIGAFKDYGIALEDDLVHLGDFFKESGYVGTQRFLDLPSTKRPTAIFACNDEMALGAFEAIWDAGLKVPEDMALVGFNNVATTAIRSIEITTVSQQKQEMGRLGLKRLIDKIEKNRGYTKPYHVVLEPRLIVRKSCGFSVSSKYVLPPSEKRQI
ncbi:MAG: LacI family DNA-binding transcriptional regulator [Desulfomonile tiedjei]|nr:LacI family DNA-binding transcriptional regulator [Desulfomonile tiedjei]